MCRLTARHIDNGALRHGAEKDRLTMKVVVKKTIGMAVAVMMLLGAGKAVAASDYDAMRLKAEPFFGYQECGSALAM